MMESSNKRKHKMDYKKNVFWDELVLDALIIMPKKTTTNEPRELNNKELNYETTLTRDQSDT